MINQFNKYLDSQIEVLKKSPTGKLSEICKLLLKTKDAGKRIYIAGNGGSAATASHFNNDLVKGCSVQNKKRFKSFCLCDMVPVITALGNDYEYSEIFKQQLMNYAEKDDVLIVISGSGNSSNVVKAVEYANSTGVHTIGLTGRDGGKIAGICDIIAIAGTDGMEQIEDIHMVWVHAMICILKNSIINE